MAGYLTNYANDLLQSLLFGGTAFTPPATYYVGLSQAAANKAGSVTEPSGGSYARVAVTNNTANFPAASAGVTSNANAVTFPAPTGSWGTVASCFLADASSGGNVIAMADLTTPVSLTTGASAPAIAGGALYLSDT